MSSIAFWKPEAVNLLQANFRHMPALLTQRLLREADRVSVVDQPLNGEVRRVCSLSRRFLTNLLPNGSTPRPRYSNRYPKRRGGAGGRADVELGDGVICVSVELMSTGSGPTSDTCPRFLRNGYCEKRIDSVVDQPLNGEVRRVCSLSRRFLTNLLPNGSTPRPRYSNRYPKRRGAARRAQRHLSPNCRAAVAAVICLSFLPSVQLTGRLTAAPGVSIRADRTPTIVKCW